MIPLIIILKRVTAFNSDRCLRRGGGTLRGKWSTHLELKQLVKMKGWRYMRLDVCQDTHVDRKMKKSRCSVKGNPGAGTDV